MIFENGRPIRRGRLQQIAFYLWGGFAASGSIFVFCAVWHYAALALGDLVLPAPLVVFGRAVELLQNFSDSEILITFYRALIALSISIFCGIGAGILAGLSKTLSLLLRPLITILLGMPPIVWVVLSLFWFGMGNVGIVFTIVVSVAPLLFAAAMRGMMTVDEGLREMLTAYRLSYFDNIKHLYIPHLLNYLLPATIVAVGTGVKITIMAELLGASDGIGSKISDARTMLDMQEVLAYVVVVLAIIMIIEYLLLEPLRILLMPWEDR